MPAKSETERWMWWRNLFLAVLILDLFAAGLFAGIEWMLFRRVSWTVFAGLAFRVVLWGGLAGWANGRRQRAASGMAA